MKTLPELLEKNRRWAAARVKEDPQFFTRLSEAQQPKHFWIGCSDSRVPANQIMGLEPGEVFVHRNVANVVIPSDLNMLSALQFAIEVLKVEHVIVCGHYGCGGVKAAITDQRAGLVDNWLCHVREAALGHAEDLAQLTVEERINRMCELNVIEQASHVVQTTVLRDAWARGQRVDVHRWIYSLRDGLLHEVAPVLQKP
ncbi:MAG: carbonate dehydratase [Verrucomicrobiota bacterium]